MNISVAKLPTFVSEMFFMLLIDRMALNFKLPNLKERRELNKINCID